MTTFRQLSDSSSFFIDAFFGDDSSSGVGVDSFTDTFVALSNLGTGVIAAITGTGFDFSGTGRNREPTEGTIRNITFFDDMGGQLGTVTDVNWGAVEFAVALDQAFEGNLQPFADLLNEGGPITIDFQNASAEDFTVFSVPNLFAFQENFGEVASPLLNLVTQPITVEGGDEAEEDLVGGSGNDTISSDGTADGVDFLFVSAGNDTYNLNGAGVFDEYVLFYDLAVSSNASGDSSDSLLGIDVRLSTSGATIEKLVDGITIGTDTFLNINTALLNDNLSIRTSSESDDLTITLNSNQSFDVFGVGGGDFYNLEIGGSIGLNYRGVDRTAGEEGIDANLLQGRVTVGGVNDVIDFSGAGELILTATSGDDRLIGSNRDDVFIGTDGSDVISGGLGSDQVRYDAGLAEFVFVDLQSGTAIKTGIFSDIELSDRLSSIEEVIGTEFGNDTILGSDRDDLLQSLGGQDSLNGGSGNDTLDGGFGADLLIGGQDSDLFIVDDIGDRVAESRNWQGTDTVQSSVSFRLGTAHIENLELVGEAEIGAGNGLQNIITGSDANNTLDGGRNVDTLIGGLGNDRYLIRAPGDSAVEEFGEGNDVVLAFRSYALEAHIEQLFMQNVFTQDGRPANLNGIGNGLDNTIVGTPFGNTLIGREGNDTLRGQAGADTFVFDRDLGANNVDRIIDFNVNETNEGDVLQFRSLIVDGLDVGALADVHFATGTSASDVNDRFVFDQNSGQLWFDGDGSGAGEQVLVATFEQNALVTADDIFIV